MKKLLLSVFMLVACLTASAQFTAGTKYLNASITGLDLSYSTSEKLRFGGEVNGGFFMADAVMLKAGIGYNHTRYIDDFSANLGLRYYCVSNGIFLGAGGEYVHYTKNSNDVLIPVEIGYTFYLNHYVAIEPSVYYKMSIDDFSDKSTVGFKLGFGFYF